MFWKRKPKSNNKWHNKPCYYKGIHFDSEKERDRYIFLEHSQQIGIISELKDHPVIEIAPRIVGYKDVVKHLKKGDKVVKKKYVIQKAINYEPDFTYVDSNGNFIVEDVKGSEKTLTKVYQLKKKLVRALKGIEVIEVYNPTQKVAQTERKEVENEGDKE